MSYDWDLIFKGVQAVGTTILGGAAFWLAYMKFHDDREKIKNDLWSERYLVYKESINMISSMKIHSIKNCKITPEFQIAMQKSKFLFPDDAPYKLMSEIWDVLWMQNEDFELEKWKPADVFAPYLNRRL